MKDGKGRPFNREERTPKGRPIRERERGKRREEKGGRSASMENLPAGRNGMEWSERGIHFDSFTVVSRSYRLFELM